MKKSGTQMNTLKKVLQYIETYRFWMLASIVLAAVTVALTLYIPILVGRAIDFIIDRGNVDFVSITKLLVEIAILAVSTAVLQWIMNTINNKVTYQVVHQQLVGTLSTKGCSGYPGHAERPVRRNAARYVRS